MRASEQKLVVTPEGNLNFNGHIYPCALGRGGRSPEKKEGDGVTPVGSWPVRRVLYRPDRLEVPDCKLTAHALSPENGWCDDPGHADYNQMVHLPHPASCENLWRADHVYDLIVALGYNDDPVVAGAGSAIFFHVAKDDFKPTEGCVAVRLKDLLLVLAHLEPGSEMIIQPED